MKKRLLSAVLALAMALTLLPGSVLSASAAVSAGVDGDSASYQTRNNANNNYPDGPGWYVTHVDKTTTPATTTYEKIDSGFIVSGKYYSTFPTNATTGKPLSTTFTAIGTVTANVGDATSVNADVYGKGTTLTIEGASLTTITVNDSKYQTEVQQGLRAAADRGSVVLPTSLSTVDKAIRISLSNVESTSNVTFSSADKGNVSRSITLTNATIGDVSLNGVNSTSTTHPAAQTAQNITANRSPVTGAPGNGIGNITIVGNGSQINLTDTSLSSSTISLTGTGTSLTASGSTVGTGDITLLGSNDSQAPKTTTAPRVTVNGTSLGAIKQGSGEVLTSNYTIAVNSQATVASIAIPNANVTVTSGTVTGDVTMGNGSLKIGGTYSKVGGVKFESATAGVITEFSVSGSNNSVGAVTTTADKVTFTKVSIPADATNKFTSMDLDKYAGKGILGGTFGTAITAAHRAYLSDTLNYEVTVTGGTAYFAKDKLSDAIVACTDATTAGNIIIVGQTNTNNITLSVGGVTLAKVGFSVAPSSIILPSVVNGVTYSNWTLTGTDSQPGIGSTYLGGAEFTRSIQDDITLDAQAVTAVVTKVTGATAAGVGDNANIKVELKGNVITLSGAATSVSGGMAGFKVNLTTDILDADGKALVVPVTVNWNSQTGKATFARDVAVGYGVTFPDENTMRLDNGTTYTVSGSGLKELVTTFDTYMDGKEIKATVSASGFTTDLQKKPLIEALTKGGAEFDVTNSPAMLQAINAAMATISASQVTSWTTQVQRQIWNKTSSASPTAADLASTGYNQVKLIPYLNVNVTNYQANGSITMTATPYYRVEVWHKDDTDGTSTTNPPVVVKQGTSLGTLASDLTKGDGTGGVSVKFNLGGSFASGTMHQDGAYAYDLSSGAWLITHAGKSGLGTLVINSTPATVILTRQAASNGNAGAEATYKYDSLQAAVDDTLPQANDKWDKITVTGDYKGTGSISVSGAARTFEIETKGNTTITAGASADVKVTTPATGHTYTIQLLRDNVTSASIVVNSDPNNNGTAAVTSNNVNAKPGEQVTVTLTPKQGYTGTITAKTNSGAAVSVTNNGNNTFTFTVPANATRVDVTPVFTPVSALPFTDVAATANYYNAVKYCYEKGMIQGTTSTTFAPNSTITRAQIVTILWRQAGAPRQTPAGIYKDMPGNSDFYNAVIWATNNNIAQGYEDGKFYPDRAINRQELATFLYRYQVNVRKGTTAGSVNNLNSYTDGGEVGLWAQPAMRWAVGNGIVSASGSRLTPKDAAPRWQAATAMYMYCSGVLGIV